MAGVGSDCFGGGVVGGVQREIGGLDEVGSRDEA